MAEINMLEALEHPERITAELFCKYTRHDQFMILDERPDFRELFLKLNGAFTKQEEFEMIMSSQLSCEDATSKDEFTGHDIQEFIIEEVLHVDEFLKMNYAERLDGHAWSEILANTDPDGAWKDYCDFSKFNNADWINLLSATPEYADRCPFGKLTQSEIYALLREQPGLAEKCGITDAAGLYLVNDTPCKDEETDIPFYPSLPADVPRKELTAWLKASFPEMTEHDISRWLHTICFNKESCLGIYSRSVAEKKAETISKKINFLKNFHLTVNDV